MCHHQVHATDEYMSDRRRASTSPEDHRSQGFRSRCRSKEVQEGVQGLREQFQRLPRVLVSRWLQLHRLRGVDPVMLKLPHEAQQE